MRDDMARAVAAYEQTVRSTIALAQDFSDADYDLPTDLPGWTVKDVLSHLIGIERMLLGDPVPQHTLPEDLPHIRNDFARMLEVDVDVRRPVPGPEVLAELTETLERRLVQLPGIDPDQETIAPTGRTVPYVEFMTFRAFDCYVHEQDVRRAVGRPGNLDAPAAEYTRYRLGFGLPFVVGKKAGAEPGQTVRFEVTGPAAFTRHIAVGDDRRARDTDPVDAPTATLTMDWETFMLLSTGRRTPDTVPVPATVAGDQDLATRVLANMNTTP
ncbi:maleylpyruvate isomerase family mycothiol-dependent enzyme [Thermomonospora cellulosilytica]|uniref:Uncharacterized protein (TIGR03083 family) n=1 Tax=Thermomonospora cellulosilytica TaxID=1411118 RepID=A0A7W3N500_9ACTN|nr:maleylpyruvate isomerase family mycothiol-dependent enzyme [Thermomonospora cellulosilytica]MBA9007625.1 uncharacterized protein (TIGR03083 family) [Thermomonospora cellulosilytica]